MGPRQYIADQQLAKSDVSRALRERVQLCQDPQTEFALLRESPGVTRINHIFRVHGHTNLDEEEAAKLVMQLVKDLPKGFSQGSPRTIRGKPRSTTANQELVTQGQLMLPEQHSCSRTAASGHDSRCSHSGFTSKHLLLARLDAIIGAATAVNFEALDDSEKPTARLYLRKAVQVADEF